MAFMKLGKIAILNGVPRSGKSSIAQEIQKQCSDPWLNLGVDHFKEHITPEKFGPGLGLRPGANRPELETHVAAFYAALYGSVAAHSRQGLNVVVDIAHHEAYSRPLGTLKTCAETLEGLPALLVGVRCPVEVIMERRNAGQPGREGVYATSGPAGEIPESVKMWQEEVHRPGIYDLEADTSKKSAPECARLILEKFASQEGFTALEQIQAGE
jgi:chloramphenicol 3-O phosphotransferase